MVLSFTVAAGCSAVFMRTEVGRQALVDQWERTALAFGRSVDEAGYAALVAFSENAVGYAVVTAFARGPLLACALAAAILVVFGRAASYTQALSVTAHASLILALQQLVAAPLNYLGETTASPTTVGRLFQAFDEASLPARFLGTLDLFVVWWLLVVAAGVAVLYGRPARPVAMMFVGVYVGIAAVLAIAMAVTGGTV